MPHPVRVGRSFREPGFACFSGVASLLFALTIFVVMSPRNESREVGLKMLVITGPAALVMLWLGFRIYRTRGWLTDTGIGFIYRDYRGEAEVEDRQVLGVGSGFRLGYVRGIPRVTTRTAVILVEGESEPRRYRVTYSFRLSAHDPLGELFDRLEESGLGAAERRLAAGGVVHGEGWAAGAGRARGGDRRGAPATPFF